MSNDALAIFVIPLSGNLLVSGSRDNTVRVWNIESLNCVHVLSQHTDEVNSVQIKVIIVCMLDKHCTLCRTI